MTFLYVDRITEYQPGRMIRGLKNVTRSEDFLYPTDDGRRRLATTIVIEAAAQMGSWLAILDSNFTKRPLFLGEDLAEFQGSAYAGDMIDLTAELVRLEDDVLETISTATVNGKVIMKTQSSKGFMVPMEDYASADEVKRRYGELYRPKTKEVKRVQGPVSLISSPYWAISKKQPRLLLDGIIAHDPFKSVEAFKNVSRTEAFFGEHFPRKPIVPGVIILGMVSDACEYLIRQDRNALGPRRRLEITKLINGRFRKMVEPGDQCIIKVKTKRLLLTDTGGKLAASVIVLANDARVAVVELEFNINGAVQRPSQDVKAG